MSNRKVVASPDKQLSMLKLDKKEEKAIFRAARILKEKYPVKKVILFGSKARGDDEEGSDIDLFLLTSRPLRWKERERVIGELFDIEIEFDVVISILDTAISEWYGGIFRHFPIHENIYHEGVVAV